MASGLDSFDAGWFTGGILSWVSGANSGTIARVLRHGGGQIELAVTTRLATEVGDAFLLSAGCDKSFATCGAKFANRINFRGFPHMPGADAILAGPSSDRRSRVVRQLM